MGLRVQAIKMQDKDLWIDVGTPQTYWKALSQTFEFFDSSNTT